MAPNKNLTLVWPYQENCCRIPGYAAGINRVAKDSSRQMTGEIPTHIVYRTAGVRRIILSIWTLRTMRHSVLPKTRYSKELSDMAPPQYELR